MIEKIEDLGLSDKESIEEISLLLKERLGISLEEIKLYLSSVVSSKADTIAKDFINIAPDGNYENLLRETEDIENFLKNEACKPEFWKLKYLSLKEPHSLIDFVFYCTAVDDGDTFVGHVLVSKSGKIRHAFAQGE